MKPVPVILALAVIVTSGAAAATSGPPPGLSTRGRALWNFEALLHDIFGNRPVCRRASSLNFVAPSSKCIPLATWQPYMYVFAGARHSAFHLVARRPEGSFGNYPRPVRISGRFVACDRRDQAYLIEFADAATFTVACSSPAR